jgi:hypothetical protein
VHECEVPAFLASSLESDRFSAGERQNPSPTNSSTNIHAMPPPPHDYDSDNSGDDDVSKYTETTVLLGYAEPSPSEDVISHLGGEPVTNPHHLLPQSLPPSAKD